MEDFHKQLAQRIMDQQFEDQEAKATIFLAIKIAEDEGYIHEDERINAERWVYRQR